MRLLRNNTTVDVYNLTNSNQWALNTSFAYAGDLGGGIGSNVSIASARTFSLPSKIKKLNFSTLKDTVTEKMLELIGIPGADFTDEEDLEYFKQGVVVALDENIIYGWYNRLFGLEKHEDEYYFLTGHQLIDAASIAFWATVSVDTALTANAAFATAAASASAGALMAATGVGVAGGVVLEANALGALLTGSMSTLVSGTAVIMSARSGTILESTAAKIKGLPTYNSGNFRRNLIKEIGDPPKSMGAADAHHVFPKKFKGVFNSVLKEGGIQMS